MIIIYTDRDLAANCEGVPLDIIRTTHIDSDIQPSANWAEDVYFWRKGEVKALKRRNAPLVVPEWLKDRTDVDR